MVAVDIMMRILTSLRVDDSKMVLTVMTIYHLSAIYHMIHKMEVFKVFAISKADVRKFCLGSEFQGGIW